MNISDNTNFFGTDLGKYRKVFGHNMIVIGQHVIKTIWINENSSSYNFIVQLGNDMECFGTAIEVGNWVQTVYVAGICDSGEVEL